MKRFLAILLLWIPVLTAHGQGIELGGSYNIQNGSFRAPCGCTFLDGKGAGLLVGIPWNIISFMGLTVGLEPGFDFQQFHAYENPSDPPSDDELLMQLRYLTLQPYVRLQFPHSHFFVQAAPQAGYLLSNTFEHTSHPVPDPIVDVDSSMGDLESMRFSARLSAGYFFDLPGLEIAPMLTVDLPLNNIRPNATLDPFTDIGLHGSNGWRITTINASIEAFFK